MTTQAAAPPKRLLDYLGLAQTHLAAKGIESARLDAELLLAHALGLGRIDLYTGHDRPLTPEEVARYRGFVRRRAAREPTAYITGTREFWSLELEVDRRVLVPRPETELLVESALAVLRGIATERDEGSSPLGLLELCTGSGAIAVALASELAALHVVATDVSEAALEVAPGNARRHGLTDRIEFRQGDLFEALRAGECFDVIVANPPYCKRAELEGLAPEIREWEPTLALISGDDGMGVTERIIAGASRFLRPGGSLLLEVGTQAALVRERLEHAPWRDVRATKDLAGHVRGYSARLGGS